MLKINVKDRVLIKKEKQLAKSEDEGQAARKRKWDWVGHNARMRDNRWIDLQNNIQVTIQEKKSRETENNVEG